MIARGVHEGGRREIIGIDVPHEHWRKLRSTNPLERVNRETGRRSEVGCALIRHAGSLLIERNDECLVMRRYLSEETMQLVLARTADAGSIVEVARCRQPDKETSRRGSCITTRDLTLSMGSSTRPATPSRHRQNVFIALTHRGPMLAMTTPQVGWADE